MIEITYDGKTGITIHGHAEAGEYGDDLVCAAVSSLTQTLAESCENRVLMSGWAVLGGGNEEVFKAFAKGYALLAIFFPDCVHYKCETEDKKQE